MTKIAFIAKSSFSIVFVLLLGTLQLVELANANPLWGVYPSEANLDVPTLVVDGTANYTVCTGESVFLNFTVTKPRSWNEVVAPFGSPAVGVIDSVNVSVNGKQVFQDFLKTDYLNGTQPWEKSYSISTGELEPGNNTIKVTVFAQSLYFNESSINNTVSHHPLNTTDTLYITFSQTPNSPPTQLSPTPSSSNPSLQNLQTENEQTPPTTIQNSIAIVAAAAIILALLIFLKKKQS